MAEIRFCTAPDGVRLAYSMHGRGPPLVRVATWLTHLELDCGVSGLLYVRRRMSSPPVVFRGYTAKSLAEQIREHEARRQ